MSTEERFRPGDRLRRIGPRKSDRRGEIVVIDRRKSSDDGWWLTNGAGLADYAIEQDWERA